MKKFILIILFVNTNFAFSSDINSWDYKHGVDEFSDKKYSLAIIGNIGDSEDAGIGVLSIGCEDNIFQVRLGNGRPLISSSNPDKTYVDWIIDKEKKSNDEWNYSSRGSNALLTQSKAIIFAKRIANAKQTLKFRLKNYSSPYSEKYEFNIDKYKLIDIVLEDCGIK